MYQTSEDKKIQRYAHPCKIEIDYSKMQVGDIWGIASNMPHAIIIKAKTWGWLKVFSLKHCNHIAVVVKIEKQFFLVEALSHIVVSSCHKYLAPKVSNGFQRVCFIGRFGGMNDLMPTAGKQIAATRRINAWLLTVASLYADYDLSGCLGTEIDLFKNNPNKLFCSELAMEAIRENSHVRFMTKMHSSKITPMHFQRFMPSNLIDEIVK